MATVRVEVPREKLAFFKRLLKELGYSYVIEKEKKEVAKPATLPKSRKRNLSAD